MTRSERTRLFRFLARIVSCAERAENHVAGWGRHPLEDLKEVIAKQERQHRRFAPAGHRHLFSVPQAVDYFVARTLAEGLDAPDKPLVSYEGVREDYLKAALLMCNDTFRTKFLKYLGESFPSRSPEEVLKLAKHIDYVVLTEGKDSVKFSSEEKEAWAFAQGVGGGV